MQLAFLWVPQSREDWHARIPSVLMCRWSRVDGDRGGERDRFGAGNSSCPTHPLPVLVVCVTCGLGMGNEFREDYWLGKWSRPVRVEPSADGRPTKRNHNLRRGYVFLFLVCIVGRGSGAGRWVRNRLRTEQTHERGTTPFKKGGAGLGWRRPSARNQEWSRPCEEEPT